MFVEIVPRKRGKNVGCSKDSFLYDFRNRKSLAENQISGLCQKCQDKTFMVSSQDIKEGKIAKKMFKGTKYARDIGGKVTRELKVKKNKAVKSENVCWNCGKFGKKKCGNCRVAKYCSKECQRVHWKEHKPICRKVTKTKNEF